MLLRCICSVLLAILFWTVGMGQTSQVEYDDLQKANRLFDQNRFNLALNYYIPIASEADPGEFVLFRTAYCYLQSRQLDQSIAMFSRLLSQSPEHQQGLFYLAYALRMKGEYKRAADYFGRLDGLGSQLGKYWSETVLFGLQSDQDMAFFTAEPSELRTENEDIFASAMLNQLIFSQTIQSTDDPSDQGVGPGFKRGSNMLFSSPAHLRERKPFHSEKPFSYNTGPVSFSPATGMIAYAKNNFHEGVRQVAQAQKGMSIHLAYLDEFNNWVEHHEFPFNDSSYSVGYPFISQDGEVLYFASNMPGGYGGFDIYVSYLIDSAWTEPQNLGPRINTPGDEISPFFDGYNLYFASDWHPGYGGLDIFRADFDYESWEIPVNLGKSVNSSYDDFGFVFYSRLGKGFMISDRPVSGRRTDNIWEVRSRTKTVVVKVFDFKKKNTITGALIDLSRCGVNSGISDESGEFEFQIAEGFDCYIGINKVGFTSTSFRLKYQDIEGQRKQYKLMLTGTVNFFEGNVVEREGDMSLPVQGVYISAINEVDGEVQETYSDERGRFDLHIKPKSRYLLSFAKAGYRPHYININTDLKVNSSVIGQVQLVRADNVVIRDVFSKSSKPAKESSEPAKRKTTTAPILQGDQISASVDDVPLKSTSKKSAAEKQAESGQFPPSAIRIGDYKPDSELAGYVIQVAAISRRNFDITPFKTYLSAYGDLYFTRRDDNLVRIMVGVFKKRSEAEDMLYKIRADKFKEAFITELPKGIKLEPLENLFTQNRVQLPPIEADPVTSSPEKAKDETTVKKQEIIAPKSGATTEYLVQIGKFKSLNWFDNRKVEDIGLIEERREGGFIIVLLSGYLDLSEAQDALRKVKEIGYNDAFIVKSGADRRLERVR